MAFAFPLIVYNLHNPTFILSNIFYLLIPLLIVTTIALELKWRTKERKSLAERDAERQLYLSEIFKAQENERHRIARELHDDATQTLLAIVARTQILGMDETVRNQPLIQEQVDWIKDTARATSEELRRLSMDLRPGILDNLGLVPALRWLVTGLSRDNINGRLELAGTPRQLCPDADINLFRILQEALSNIRRHSKATDVWVKLEFYADKINLIIEDNGIGFDSSKTYGELTATGKLGLTGMHQRVQFLGGTINFESEHRKGVKISIEIKA